MTIQELETMILDCKAECQIEAEILNGLYSSIANQQALVDKLQSNLKRLCDAQAALKGIEG
jgi:uncharacterized coiled-coil protein SlyX